jgi:hypothetical protein
LVKVLELHTHYLGRGRPIRGRCDIQLFELTLGG